MNKNQKALLKILLAAAIYLVGIIYKGPPIVTLAIFLAAFAIVGLEVVLEAFRNILHGQVFDENFLMSIATIGAFAIGEYPEGVAVMLFYQVGELFQNYAVNKSRKSIGELMDIRPDYANVFRGADTEKIDPSRVEVGENILIKPGEKIPLDAVIVTGNSLVDTSALTGESVPREVGAGDDILSGCINVSGVLTAKVTKEFAQSTASKILDLVENASSKKSKSEKFITKFARYYTPTVVIIAAFLGLVPPLLLGGEWSDWVYRALIFLVISCPCALVISVPLSFFGGIGGASRCGVLVKGSNYLEALSKAEVVVFDKTGTLTKGVFKVVRIVPQGISEKELLEKAAYAESFSAHPISLSLKAAYGGDIDKARVSEVTELSGYGITAKVDGKTVAAGNYKLMEKLGIPYDENPVAGTIVHVAIEGSYSGSILIADEVKKDAASAISGLKKLGIARTVMLTGDRNAVGQEVGQALKIDEVYTELLPTHKVEKLEQLLQGKSQKGTLCFVGDGINDAPTLARADVGIAMGALGSDAAIEAADIVIMTDEPSKIVTAIKLSQKTMRIVKQNIIFAIGIKLIFLGMGAFGVATMWEAVFADVGVSVIAIINALRALNTKNL
ncbi:MAG: heavy metal translocating P-type ATPase [Oscillospiraceae bacterium]